MSSFKGDLVLVDGKQRLNATLEFLDNKLPAFGSYFTEYTDNMRGMTATYEVFINNLNTRGELLTWYLQLNSGGTPHSKKEIDRVRQLLQEEESKPTL